MNDIAERLRARADEQERSNSYLLDQAMDREAADEIERLENDLQDHQSRSWTERGELNSEITQAREEIERLTTENWQLKQACGYPIPADKETINNPFKCGTCDARQRDTEAN